jgi:hypothetical protein
MRTLAKVAATLGVIGAIAVSSTVPAAAWYGYHHRYYGYHHRYYHHRYYAYYPRAIITPEVRDRDTAQIGHRGVALSPALPALSTRSV